MLHSDVLVETKPYIHAMKQHVIQLMGIVYFQCKSGSITCATFGAVARTLTLLHSNKLVLRCNEQLQLLVLK